MSDQDEAYDMISRRRGMCGRCQQPSDKCGCVPTEDGPGQPGAEPEHETAKGSDDGQ